MTHALAFALGLLAGIVTGRYDRWRSRERLVASFRLDEFPGPFTVEPYDDLDYLAEYRAPGHGTGDLLHTWRETTPADRRN